VQAEYKETEFLSSLLIQTTQIRLNKFERPTALRLAR
jgi:hypothetical protein